MPHRPKVPGEGAGVGEWQHTGLRGRVFGGHVPTVVELGSPKRLVPVPVPADMT